jgi:hypothetical protein
MLMFFTVVQCLATLNYVIHLSFLLIWLWSMICCANICILPLWFLYDHLEYE